MYLSIVILSLLFWISPTKCETCKTPNNEPGDCILLKSCPPLLQMSANKTASSMEFILKSICGFDGGDSKVCCSLQSNSSPTVDQNKEKQSKKDLLPNRRYCGYQHSDDYAHDTNVTIITEFPWLARLVHRKNSESPDSYEKMYLCLGSLISDRYILTTAVCVTAKNLVTMEVQLGEYNIANDTDCVVDTSIEECSNPVETYGIEKTIVHSEYNRRLHLNDIALIRLNSTVTYSDYIRPICLPYPETSFAKPGDVLTISGWGFLNSKGDEAIIKKRVLSSLLTQNECMEMLNKHRTTIRESYLCTRALENITEVSCQGDAGAPVIFSHRLQWHQEGIVSFGGKDCGGDFPDVNTRVQTYLDWIEENIEP